MGEGVIVIKEVEKAAIVVAAIAVWAWNSTESEAGTVPAQAVRRTTKRRSKFFIEEIL